MDYVTYPEILRLTKKKFKKNKDSESFYWFIATISSALLVATIYADYSDLNMDKIKNEIIVKIQ